eukprot:EG_transcript_1582
MGPGLRAALLAGVACHASLAQYPSPLPAETSIFAIGREIFSYSEDVNLIFVIVVLSTVLLELGMQFLLHRSQDHSRLLMTHLNKELALLGIVAFVLMTLASAQLPLSLVKDIDVFEWCHVILFFVAVLTIASNLYLNFILKWQEGRFRMYEQQHNATIVNPKTSFCTSSLYLKFALARFVFESDRRKFFSTQLLRAASPQAPWPPASVSTRPHPLETQLSEPLTDPSPTNDDRPPAGVPHTEAQLEHLPAPKPNPDSHIVDAASLLRAVCQTSSPSLSVENPLLPARAASTPTAPAEGAFLVEDPGALSLDEHLRTLRITPLLVKGLIAGLQNRRSVAPDEFSFAEYFIRCTRKELVKLLHTGWLSWAILLCVFSFLQLPAQFLSDRRGQHKVYVISGGAVMFALYFSLWAWSALAHRRCMRRLVEVAFLYFAVEGDTDAEGQPPLEAALTSAFPQTVRRLQQGNLLSSVDAQLKNRQTELYRRSIVRQKKRRSLWARFQYPRVLNLSLQVLMMWMGFYFSVFLMTCAPRIGTHDWDLTEGLLWIPGLGVPAAFYAYFLPSIMFHHTFLVSVGNMVDLKVMRQIEQEQREKRKRHQHETQRRRRMTRIRSKLSIMAAVKADTWDVALRHLLDIEPTLPLSISLHLVSELRQGAVPEGGTVPPSALPSET